MMSHQTDPHKTTRREMEPGTEQFYSQRLPLNRFDRELILSTTDSMAVALAQMAEDGAAALLMLDQRGCDLLLETAEQLNYRACAPVVGTGEKAVAQDFDISLNFRRKTRFDDFSAAFERQMNEALRRLPRCPCQHPLYFNDRVVLRYPQGSRGISPHQDLKRFEGIIAILTLSGRGDFYICADRQKTNSRLLRADPGVMIVMRGANCGASRPFHYVENIEQGRVAFGLRYDAQLSQKKTYRYDIPE